MLNKGDIVYLKFKSANTIFMEELENNLFLGASPFTHTAYVYSMDLIDKGNCNAFKKSDIEYCIKNLTCEQLSKDEFLQEISDKKLCVKNRIIEILEKENILEPFTVDDICNAADILTDTTYNIELLELYNSLSKLQKMQIKETAKQICKISNKVKKTIYFIIVIDENTPENSIYTDIYPM